MSKKVKKFTIKISTKYHKNFKTYVADWSNLNSYLNLFIIYVNEFDMFMFTLSIGWLLTHVLSKFNMFVIASQSLKSQNKKTRNVLLCWINTFPLE